MLGVNNVCIDLHKLMQDLLLSTTQHWLAIGCVALCYLSGSRETDVSGEHWLNQFNFSLLFNQEAKKHLANFFPKITRIGSKLCIVPCHISSSKEIYKANPPILV